MESNPIEHIMHAVSTTTRQTKPLENHLSSLPTIPGEPNIPVIIAECPGIHISLGVLKIVVQLEVHIELVVARGPVGREDLEGVEGGRYRAGPRVDGVHSVIASVLNHGALGEVAVEGFLADVGDNFGTVIVQPNSCSPVVFIYWKL